MAFSLQILHASDFEAGIPAIDDAVRFSAILNGFKNNAIAAPFQVSNPILANTLTLSSGDNYIPGPFFNASSDLALNGVGGLGTSTAPVLGRADVAILNEFGIQASALGNHEFDLGIRQVRDILRSSGGSPGLNFPYLSANLDFAPEIASGRGDIALSDLATDQNTAEASTIKGKIAKSTIITLPGNDGIAGNGDDQRIGIVGATTPTLRNISSPGSVEVLPANATDYAALAAEIQASVDALTAQGINKIVLLSHMQQLFIERDELAPRLNNVDIIIAGGSHTALLDENDVLRPGTTDEGDYPIVRTSANGQPVLVLNTDANYRYVGRLVTEFDDNGVLNLNSLNTTLNGAYGTDEAGVDRVYGSDVDPRTLANPNVVAITDTLRTVIGSKDNNITGSTEFFLNGTRTDVRTQETNLGNLTADANLAYAQQIDPTVVISLKNGGGIRDNIGTVTAAAGATDPNDVQKLPPQPNSVAPNKQEGDVSQLDIENSLRFNNDLTLITVTAQQLRELLEQGVADTGPGRTPGRFPQVGGLVFSFDPSLPAAEDLNGNGILNTGEDRNGNGVLDAGQRIRTVGITNDNGKITDLVVRNGAIVGDPNRTFRLVTLNFLAGTTPGSSGDGYTFFQYVNANPTLANRVDLRGETAADLNGNGVIDSPVAIPAGQFTFAGAGSEQDALAEYLGQLTDPFDQADTPAEQDRRIQDLSVRPEGVVNLGFELQGNARRNILRGQGGPDILNGRGGNDRLLGLGGNDILLGGAGNDELRGGAGADILDGGRGSDLYIGGPGADIFVLQRGIGFDTIRDFRDGVDKLAIRGNISFADLTLGQVGRNTTISLRNDLLAVLRNVQVDQISGTDFRPLPAAIA